MGVEGAIEVADCCTCGAAGDCKSELEESCVAVVICGGSLDTVVGLTVGETRLFSGTADVAVARLFPAGVVGPMTT